MIESKTYYSTERSLGNLYRYEFMFGVLSFTKIGALAKADFFGFTFFKRFNEESLLFGVNW